MIANAATAIAERSRLLVGRGWRDAALSKRAQRESDDERVFVSWQNSCIKTDRSGEDIMSLSLHAAQRLHSGHSGVAPN